MAKGHWSGTTAHSNMEHHGGKVEGAGELAFGTGPGKRAMKTKIDHKDFGIMEHASSKEKGVKSYNQE